jgi:hypothetical protein
MVVVPALPGLVTYGGNLEDGKIGNRFQLISLELWKVGIMGGKETDYNPIPWNNGMLGVCQA